VHIIGIADNDVKPANMLRAEGGRHVLCDFGNAVSWQEGVAVGSQRGATAQFAVVEGEFAASDNSLFACDMEGLFWSVLAMWLQVKERGDTIPRLSEEERRNALCGLIARGRVVRGDASLTPTAPLLISYFNRVKTGVLSDARDVWRSHKALFKGDEAAWMRSVAEREKAESLPRCRPEILAWLLKRTN
jgi:serine/threonine protein kinase